MCLHVGFHISFSVRVLGCLCDRFDTLAFLLSGLMEGCLAVSKNAVKMVPLFLTALGNELKLQNREY